MITMRLEGAVELEKALKRMEPKAAKAVIRKALRPQAKALANEAKAMAPRLTGSLVQSIRIRAGRRRAGQYSMRVVTLSEDETTTPAFPVETGHMTGSAIVPEDPFIRRPFDRDVNRMARDIEGALWAGIAEAE